MEENEQDPKIVFIFSPFFNWMNSYNQKDNYKNKNSTK